MSVYKFMRPSEAVQKDNAAILGGIRGMRAIDADRLRRPPTRTAAGNSREPEGSYATSAYGDRDKFKVVERVEFRSGPDYDPGTAAVVYTDGTEDYISRKDLLCVEWPILPVHYGESRSLCGEFEKYDTMTTYIPGVTCTNCHTSVHDAV